MRVAMMIGIPASGKSTLTEALSQGKKVLILSPDRHIINPKNGKYEWTPEKAAEAWGKEYDAFKRAIFAKEVDLIIWDATFVSPRARKEVLRIASNFHIPVDGLVFQTPFEVCMERNSKRSHDRQVPKSAMDRMKTAYRAPTKDEGFATIAEIPGV